MKKVLIPTLIAVSLTMAGCSGDYATNAKPDEPKTEHKQIVSKYPFPASAKETGNGKISVETPSGDSSDGKIPVLFAGKDDALIEIQVNIDNFAGDKEVFYFVNKQFVDSEQGSESAAAMTLPLEQDKGLLNPGTYTVTAVQYEGNDPIKGKVVEFHQAKFEIKEKH